jgi:uncharacterized lipoprotein YbaY
MRPVRSRLVCSTLLVAALACAGCSREPAQISGTAVFDTSTPPPPDAVLEITLQEVSPPGSTATTVGVSRVAAVQASPVAFTLPYDATRIFEDREYVVQARIVSGDVRLAASGLQPVLTGGHGATVTLTLRQADDGLAEVPLVRGLFLVEGDRPQFTPCGERRVIAVADGGDYAALQAAYHRAQQPRGTPLLARVEGTIKADPPTLEITRFVSLALDQTCDSP